MKKLIAICLVAATAVTSTFCINGCKTTTDPKDVYDISYGVGSAAGVVIRMRGVDTNVVDAICLVAPELKNVIPSTNQTWKAAWTKAGTEIALALVAEGKIDAKAGELISVCSGTAGLAMDYLFWRHQEWLQSQECINSAISGAVDGLVHYIKPGANLAAPGVVDQDALLFLTAATANQK